MTVTRRGPVRVGAHMSIAGGLYQAVDRAEQVRATALQIFVKSARQWSAKPLAAEEIDRFRTRAERSGLQPYTLAHASYLINLASPGGVVRERSIRALRIELGRCAELGIPYLVLHPGSHLGAGEEIGLSRVTRALDRLLSKSSPRASRAVRVLLAVPSASRGASDACFLESSTSICIFSSRGASSSSTTTVFALRGIPACAKCSAPSARSGRHRAG